MEEKGSKAKNYRDQFGPCVLCTTRKQRYVNGLCVRCNSLTEAEGTKKKLGIPLHLPVVLRSFERIKEYNRLVHAKKRQKEIAELMGMTLPALRCLVGRARKNGAKVASARVTYYEAVRQRSAARAQEHGVGKWGVWGCKCTLCLACRAETKLEPNRRYKERKRQEKAAQQHEGLRSSAAETTDS